MPAKHRITDIIEQAHLNSGEGFSALWGKQLMMWIPDEIVKAEIIRNILLALTGVMICTAMIIANFSVCFWIFVTVILTLVNFFVLINRNQYFNIYDYRLMWPVQCIILVFA